MNKIFFLFTMIICLNNKTKNPTRISNFTISHLTTGYIYDKDMLFIANHGGGRLWLNRERS